MIAPKDIQTGRGRGEVAEAHDGPNSCYIYLPKYGEYRDRTGGKEKGDKYLQRKIEKKLAMRKNLKNKHGRLRECEFWVRGKRCGEYDKFSRVYSSHRCWETYRKHQYQVVHPTGAKERGTRGSAAKIITGVWTFGTWLPPT